MNRFSNDDRMNAAASEAYEARNKRIKSKPFIVVGGISTETRAIMILAHDGYHHGALARAAGFSVHDAPEIGPLYLAAGSTDDPVWSWPVYAQRVR